MAHGASRVPPCASRFGRLPPLFISTAQVGPASAKSRKIPQKSGKNKKNIPPRPNRQTKRTRAAALADYDQLSAIMSNYHLSRRPRCPGRPALDRRPPARRRVRHRSEQRRKPRRRRARRAVAERRRMVSSFASFRVFSGHIRPRTVDRGPWTACRALAERRRADRLTFLHRFCTVFASLFGLCFSQLTLPQPLPNTPIAAWCSSASLPFACICGSFQQFSFWPCDAPPGEGTRPTTRPNRHLVGRVPSPGVPVLSIMRIAAVDGILID